MEPSNIPPTSPNKSVLSVIIPVYNGGENFRRSLLSLAEANPPPGEIIVVGDGDTDGSWRVAEEFGVNVLRIPNRQGSARARNLGAQAAQGDILFFLDADVVIYPDAIRRVETAFSNDPQLTALFGSYDDEPGENNFLSQYKNLFHHYIHQISREDASTFWSGCGAIRRKVFLKLGGFDESYRHPSIEDIELGYRLKQSGHRIRLLKMLQVKHLKRWGVLSLLKTDFLRRALPWTQLILRDRRMINDLNLGLPSRMSVMLVYGLIAALVGAWWRPGLLALGSVLLLSLLAVNAPLYRFFERKRGFGFTLKAIAWHWVYYFYGGLAFAIGLGRYVFSSVRSTRPRFQHVQKEGTESGRFSEPIS
jgi:glycosyltransferase involved in cell wall biosynthesis